jgi:tetratricopeptide (TPR) repeat protein/class 3 adenylate cyclase
MAELTRMDRTWLCSVVFMDIADYSSQSVELQMKWKQRFNGYLAETIQEVPESDRVILDTGDGAAICFLGAPEAAMFAALQLCRLFVVDEREQQPGLRVRLGINLGPVKLVKDINGALNAIGDGINAGQRIMSFASVNQILVSQSFFEVVSRLSDDYKPLFQLKGVETDKHVREHTVYHLVPPGSEKREYASSNADGPALPSAPVVPVGAAAPPRNRSILLAAVGLVVVVLAAAGAWHFYGSARVQATPNSNAAVAQSQAPITRAPEPAPPPAQPVPSGETPVAKVKSTPVESARVTPSKPESAPAPPSNNAKAAYDEGSRLLEQDMPDEAVRYFSDALRANPDFVDAYVGRAEARRKLVQYELSLKDCNQIIRIKADDPRGYNCRGFALEQLKQYQPALRDLSEAIRLNPDFAPAYGNRGAAYSDLQQYDRAVKDFSEAIRLRPRNVAFHQKRAAAYNSLRQYDKAIQDYTEAIRIQPNDLHAYSLRAAAEDAAGDAAGAAADRRHVREMRLQK